MLCKLINLETLRIGDFAKKSTDLEIYANKNVNRIDIMVGSRIPNLDNFPSCRVLCINSMEIKISVVVSTLSAHKHNIHTVMVPRSGHGEFVAELKNLENYCKTSGIAFVTQ
jgi:hypothetical protein